MDCMPESDTPCREPIIDDKILASVLESAQHRAQDAGKARNCGNPLSEEPVLWEYLQGQLLKIVGKMAICKTRSHVMLGVYSDVSVLLDIAFDATRQAHRRLYAEFLPADAAAPPEADTLREDQ